jgi:hypothetical protein
MVENADLRFQMAAAGRRRVMEHYTWSTKSEGIMELYSHLCCEPAGIRRAGESKLKIKEMGSRYLFMLFYCWTEKYFSCGDYHWRQKRKGAKR